MLQSLLYVLAVGAALALQLMLYFVFGLIYTLFGLSGSLGFWIVVIAIAAEVYLLSHRGAPGSSSSDSA